MHYQGRLPKGRLHSRGQIVKELASCSSLEQIDEYINLLNLSRYAPFSLLVFYPEIVNQETGFPLIPLYRWTGKELVKESKRSPHFSSAVEFEQVCEIRNRIYCELINKEKTPCREDYINLHKGHLPEKSKYSICMHRPHANTVSFSHVSVGKSEINYYYSDGAPCEALLQRPVVLSRTVETELKISASR